MMVVVNQLTYLKVLITRLNNKKQTKLRREVNFNNVNDVNLSSTLTMHYVNQTTSIIEVHVCKSFFATGFAGGRITKCELIYNLY